MPAFKVKTKGFNDVINITKDVERVVLNSKVKEGIVLIFVPGSTAGITAIEYEKGVIKDLKKTFEKIAPQNERYEHEKDWHDGNGFSHARAGILGPSLTAPVENGKILLGRWQEIVLIDFDNKPREREIIVRALETK